MHRRTPMTPMLSSISTTCSPPCLMKNSNCGWVFLEKWNTNQKLACPCTVQAAEDSRIFHRLSTGLPLKTLRTQLKCSKSKTRAAAVPAGLLLSPQLLRAPWPSRPDKNPGASPSSKVLTAHWPMIEVVSITKSTSRTPTTTRTTGAGAAAAAG